MNSLPTVLNKNTELFYYFTSWTILHSSKYFSWVKRAISISDTVNYINNNSNSVQFGSNYLQFYTISMVADVVATWEEKLGKKRDNLILGEVKDSLG